MADPFAFSRGPNAAGPRQPPAFDTWAPGGGEQGFGAGVGVGGGFAPEGFGAAVAGQPAAPPAAPRAFAGFDAATFSEVARYVPLPDSHRNKLSTHNCQLCTGRR